MRLFLPYEAMWDRALGGVSKTQKQIPHWFGWFATVLCSAVFKIAFRYRVDNKKNLQVFKNKSGVLLVANHTSFMDVAFMFTACRPKQWVRIMGRESLFDNAHGLVGQILSRVGGFPVKRDSADRVAVKRAARMLKNDEIVGMLPEGTRRGKGSQVPEIHAGAAFIARMGHAPILPMTVRNAEDIKRKGERLHFPKITIEFGQPILVSDFDFLPKADRLEGCTWYAMRECFALSRRVSPDEVDMVELFPDSKDYTAIFEKHPVPQHTSEEIVSQIEAKAQAKAKADGQESAATSSGA